MPIAMDHCVWFGGQSLQLRYTDDVLLSAVGVPQAADEIQLLLPQYMLLHTHIYTDDYCAGIPAGDILTQQRNVRCTAPRRVDPRIWLR